MVAPAGWRGWDFSLLASFHNSLSCFKWLDIWVTTAGWIGFLLPSQFFQVVVK